MSGQIESLLEKGIEAARDNEKKRARDILTRVIELDQHNERAWLWLSSVVETPADKEVCLENVLYINPDNTYAAMGVQHLRYQNQPSPPSVLPRLAGTLTPVEQVWDVSSKKAPPPPKGRACPRCGFRNPGWAYLCDQCGANLRQLDLREVVSEASRPRGRSFVTLIEAWGGAFVFNGAFAFRPEMELASWRRSISALVMSGVLASVIRIIPAVTAGGNYDLKSEFASNAPQWVAQTLWLILALALVWVIVTPLTWAAAHLAGGRQSLKVHAHFVIIVASAWTLLVAVAAAIIILTLPLAAQASALELPFEQVFDLVGIITGVIGFIWLIQAIQTAHSLSSRHAIAASVLVGAAGVVLFFGLNLVTDGLFAHSIAKLLLVFFLPWLG